MSKVTYYQNLGCAANIIGHLGTRSGGYNTRFMQSQTGRHVMTDGVLPMGKITATKVLDARNIKGIGQPEVFDTDGKVGQLRTTKTHRFFLSDIKPSYIKTLDEVYGKAEFIDIAGGIRSFRDGSFQPTPKAVKPVAEAKTAKTAKPEAKAKTAKTAKPEAKAKTAKAAKGKLESLRRKVKKLRKAS
jgi:F0F1-type ATP synthase epsilon subunit